jgi:hypothetical protein
MAVAEDEDVIELTVAVLPETVHLALYRGDDFGPWQITATVAAVPIDLTDYSIKAQIRQTQDATAILADFVCTITDGPNGVFTIEMDDAQTADLPRSCKWDLQLTDTGFHTRTFMAGNVTVTPDVTRPNE